MFNFFETEFSKADLILLILIKILPMTLDKTLDAIMKLDYASQEVLFDILQKRLVEERRNQIAKNAISAKRDFAKGKLKSKSALEIISDLSKD